MKTIRTHWRMVVLLVAIFSISAIYLGIAFTMADGRPVAPLDDAYITYQYARQIARGQPYRYNDGDAPTTGMTSLLFGFFLAGAYRLGMTGERLAGFAVSLGVVWFGLTVWLTYRLVTRVSGAKTNGPWVAAALVVLAGAVQWSCFNGMETGLFTVLSLAALDTFLARKIGWCTLWLSLAGLTRPEGLILTLLLGALTLVEGLIRRRNVPWRPLLMLMIAACAGLLPMIVNYALTGTSSAAGLQAKSWVGNVPPYPLEIVRSILLSYQRILLGRFMGEYWYVTPGLLLLAVWGWFQMARDRRWLPAAMTLVWFLLGTASTAVLITALWHMGRYQVPFVPIIVLVGLYGPLRFLEKNALRWQRWVGTAILLILGVLSLVTTGYHINIYRRAVSTVTRQQLALADWLRDHLPTDAIVGIHDAGTLRYVGQRSTYDLIGLSTPDAAIPWRHGAGSVYERMEHDPQRPTHFAIYPDAFSIPYLAATDLFAEELFRVDVPDHAVASAGPVQGVWRADWRLADSGIYMVQPDILARISGMVLVDALDVADLADEAIHNVTWWQAAPSPGFPTEVQQQNYRVAPELEVLDGGRLLNGGIAFEVATRTGEDVSLIARLHAREGGAVDVRVNGQGVGRWAYPPVPGQWLETRFLIPGEAITGDVTHIYFDVDNTVPGFRHYALYYVWVLQGAVDAAPLASEQGSLAAFGEYITLRDFDLATDVWQPGDTLPITLIWHTSQATASDAKVFVHLYAADGTLGPQSDGWAYHGTRPPYTWQPGEMIVDPRYIILPPDLAPGTYTLEVGLYDATGRLPASVRGTQQPEDRVVITEIEVQK